MQSENSKTHQNLFNGGLNKDFNNSFVELNQYIDAHNVTLVDNKNFLSLHNIKGTTNLQAIIDDSTTLVLNVTKADFTIGTTVGVKCLVIFTAKPSDYFKIQAYDIVNDITYDLYRELVLTDYFTQDRLVDSVNYPENGTDLIYFTDNYNSVRKLRCQIPVSYIAWSVAAGELTLSRTGAIGYVELSSISNGGSLFCGSYLVSYQLFTPGSNKATKYSLFCQPIQIYENSGVFPYSSVGTSTTKKIVVNIRASENELDSYTHFRLAMVENIYPEGVAVEFASLSNSFAIADYLSGGVIKNVQITSNSTSGAEQVNISDIVVDLAAVKAVKTLAIRDNRLIAGNVTYKNLDLNNGTPTIAVGAVIKQPFDFYTTGNEYYLSKYVGYYRDEVYRFAISYFDEFGNFSPPSVLNLANVTGNIIDSSLFLSGTTLAIINSDFENGLTGWSQIDPGTNGPAWVASTIAPSLFGPGGKLASVSGLSNATYSDILYQAVTVTAGVYMLNIGAKFSMSLSDTFIQQNLQIVYLNNSNTILGTETIAIANASFALSLDITTLYTKKITIPPGTTRIGFRGFIDTTLDTANYLTIDNLSISTVFSDIKFPSRKTIVGATRYSVLNSDNKPENLGLSLTNIVNHPTWARGFVVLRAKRKENIKWESPLIPLVPHYGIGALSGYPTSPQNEANSVSSFPNAQPQGPNTTYFPLNYYFAKQRKFEKNDVAVGDATSGSTGASQTKMIGEARPTQYFNDLNYGLVFPSSSMYTSNSTYSYNSAHKLKTVDAALVNSSLNCFTPAVDIINKGGLGNFGNTDTSNNIYAISNGAYYYDATHVKSNNLRDYNLNIINYNSFDNLGNSFSLGGNDIFKSSNLVTDGVSFQGIDGFNLSRGAVVQLTNSDGTLPKIIDSTFNGRSTLTFANGTASTFSASSTNKFLINTTGTASSIRSNTVEIVNCITGLSDDRYGDQTTFNEYILTGTQVVFSNSELLTVTTGGSLPKSVNVWGGDCIVTRHLFKISDTVYNTANGNKFLVAGGGEDARDTANRWGYAYDIGNRETALTMLLPLKGASQYVEVFLQSKFNGMLNNTSNILTSTAVTTSKSQISGAVTRTPLIYDLNINHSKENDLKIFVPQTGLIPNVITTKSRLIYSDQKVYQGGIEGFDIFRVLNFHDLGENYGGITKLEAVKNDLYSLQEKAITYIGVGERVLEQTDADLLSVRTGDVIGTIILIDSNRGCQHMKSVQNTGNSLFFIDNRNKSVLGLVDKTLSIISDTGLGSECRTILETKLPENQLTSIYDPVKQEYWMCNGTAFTYIFNAAINKWVANYEFPSGVLGGVYTNQKLYLTGRESGILSIHEAYSKNESQLFGINVTPRVQLVVNPEYTFGKQFDDLLVVSSDRLATVDIIVDREITLGNQTCNNIPLDVTSRGLGNYKVKILRDSVDARLKGTVMKATIKWKIGTVEPVTLTSVLTQYRPILKQF